MYRHALCVHKSRAQLLLQCMYCVRGCAVARDLDVHSGALDTLGVDNRKQSRSKYGAKRPKAS